VTFLSKYSISQKNNPNPSFDSFQMLQKGKLGCINFMMTSVEPVEQARKFKEACLE